MGTRMNPTRYSPHWLRQTCRHCSPPRRSPAWRPSGPTGRPHLVPITFALLDERRWSPPSTTSPSARRRCGGSRTSPPTRRSACWSTTTTTTGSSSGGRAPTASRACSVRRGARPAESALARCSHRYPQYLEHPPQGVLIVIESSASAAGARHTRARNGSRTLYDSEHKDFGESFQAFLTEHAAPHFEQWERDGIVPREFYTEAGRAWLPRRSRSTSSTAAPASTTSASTRCSPRSASALDLAGAVGGLLLHNDICLPYFLTYCNEQQRERWLPGIVNGDYLTAVAMTEPGAGSDLAGIATRAVRVDGGCRQRRQDVHHQRHQLRPGDHGRAHRSRRPSRRPQPADHRARHGGLRARPQPREARPALGRHRRDVLRRTCLCRRRTCSAKRAWASAT